MITFTNKQAEAHKAATSGEHQFVLFGGAMGGGKTYWGLQTLLMLCDNFKGSRWCVIRENMEKLRVTTIPSFRKLQTKGKLLKSTYEYDNGNGSVILFKGENYDNDNDLNWMRGLEVNGFLFEEINECRRDTLDIAFGRAGRWKCDEDKDPPPIIMATCNPTNNWIKELVYDRHMNGTLPKTWKFIPSNINDNPYLTDAYKENLKNMPRYRYEVFVEGNWDLQQKTGGEFYKCFELDRHVMHVEYDRALPLHLSWDDNVNPYLSCGIYQVHGKELRQLDEIAGINPMNTIDAVCNEVKRRYPAHRDGMYIYGDATANKADTKLEKGNNFYRLVEYNLAEYNPSNRVAHANPGVAIRGNWINTVLEKELNGVRIIIDPRCKKTIADLMLVKESPDGSKVKEMSKHPVTNVRCQGLGHFSDCLDYILCSAFVNDFTEYRKGGKSRHVEARNNLPSRNSY